MMKNIVGNKPKWIHPLVRKMRANREAHPELSEDEMDEKMMESVFGIRRRSP